MIKTKNILQFWTDPKTPIAGRVLGVKGDIFNEAFNVVSVENARLSNGKRGKKIVAMFPSSESLPTKPQLKTREALYQIETGGSVEIVAITPEYIRDTDFDIKIVMGEITQETRDMQKALTLEKVRVYAALFPDLMNKMELANMVAEAMGDNPEQVFKQKDETMPVAPGGEAGAGAPAMPPPSIEPQGDVAGNMMRGMQGGNPMENSISGLAQ
jgi:hypothetical protein